MLVLAIAFRLEQAIASLKSSYEIELQAYIEVRDDQVLEAVSSLSMLTPVSVVNPENPIFRIHTPLSLGLHQLRVGDRVWQLPDCPNHSA